MEKKCLLATSVTFIPLEKYSRNIKAVQAITKEFSEKESEEFLLDIDFLSLALELKSPLGGHDKLLKKQSIITVLTTRQLLEILPHYKKSI